jgi:hypothetical protein
MLAGAISAGTVSNSWLIWSGVVSGNLWVMEMTSIPEKEACGILCE